MRPNSHWARRCAIALAAALMLVATGCETSSRKPAPGMSVGHVLEAPPIYTSKNGTLHLRVKAEEATSTINGRQYKKMYRYKESVVGGAGTYTPGTASDYVAPEWHVMPGDRLVLDYINDLPDVSFTPVGSTTAQTMHQPLNLHTHGLTVRPEGNGDNVLLSIPPGRSNRFTIDIPKDQHSGLYWYHPHLHGLSDDQVYEGLAGHIVVGRADGDYREFDGLTMRPMMIRYNAVEPNDDGELIDASAYDTAGTAMPPRGKMIYTVNGRVSPRIPIAAADPAKGTPAESQIWAFTNITGSASYIVAMDEVDAKDAANPNVHGRPLDLTVVSIDGTAMPAPKVLSGDATKRSYLIGQAGRVAFLVQGASDPSKVVRVLQVENRSGTGEASGSNWPEQKLVGNYRDYTGTVLAFGSGAPAARTKHVDTPAHLTTKTPSATHELDSQPVANKRTFIFNEVSKPTEQTPMEFGIDFALFPDVKMAQPKVGTVEEWTILNYSSLHHPFHLHTQYSVVDQIEAPVNPDYKDAPGQYPSLQYVTDLNQPQPADYQQDLINLPPAKVGSDGMPLLGPDGVPVAPGKIVLRTKIDDYLGTYVEHCHRLPHEDRGMMSMVRSIPNDPVVAVTRTDAAGGVVDVVRSSDRKVAATIRPKSESPGPLVAAVGDVDADTVPDVAVASTVGSSSVAIYSGASGYRDIIATVQPFQEQTAGSIALGDLNGDAHDDLVVGQGQGGSRVVVMDGGGPTFYPISEFDAYEPASKGGVSVATGILELGGRVSLITGAGPGGPPTVNVYNFDLFGDRNGKMPDLHKVGALKPIRVASFDGADPAYTGGVQVSTGYPFARTGDFAAILVAPTSGPVVLRTFAKDAGHEHMVTASGVHMPDEYEPAGPRNFAPGPTLDLSGESQFAAGARAALVSTTDAADVIAAPASGGTIQRWTVSEQETFAPAEPLTATGTSVAAM